MKPISLLVFTAGLSLAFHGCVFHPDMGDGLQCARNSDCGEDDDCACLAGKCVPASAGATCTREQECDLPELLCDDTCVDPMTDDAHCGGCNTDCSQPPSAHCIDDNTLKVKGPGPCELGECKFAEELVPCQSGCQVDRCVSDPCGGPCDSPPPARCEGDELIVPMAVGECVGDTCQYADGITTVCQFGCDQAKGECLPPDCSSDADCAAGETCSLGECLCGSNPPCVGDQACCGGACLMSANNPEHCGGCNRPCHLGLPNVWSAECMGGTCEYMCDLGMADCNHDLSDGCESNTNRDPGNCGSCGRLCGVDSCVDAECLPNANDSIVQCGPDVTCDPGSFCCVGVDSQSCSDNTAVVDCDAGHVLLCDDTADCPDGTVCCFDQDTLNASCVAEGDCVYGWVTCDDGSCPDGANCNTIDLNSAASIDLCQPR